MICAGSGFSVSLVIDIHIFNCSPPSKYKEVTIVLLFTQDYAV